MNKILIGIVIALILGGGVFFLLQNQTTAPVSQNQDQGQKQTMQQIQTTPPSDTFTTPKKSAHYETNTPEHGATLPSVPVNVVIDFNFDVAKGSQIQILNSGKDYGAGDTTIDDKNLAMRRKMDSNSPDGLYTIVYKACWADGSCHDGEFQFKIDRSRSSSFVDMTGKKEVTINMQNFTFSPAMVKVSKETKVTWVNKDTADHTVNTDSHPAHTYYLAQNSRTLQNGDTYSTTFDKPGIYLYHCTPHASTMKGQILVE